MEDKPEKSIKSLEGVLMILSLILCAGIATFIATHQGGDGLTDEMKKLLFEKALESITDDNLDEKLLSLKQMFAVPPLITWEKALSILAIIGPYFGLQGFFTKKRVDLKTAFEQVKITSK